MKLSNRTIEIYGIHRRFIKMQTVQNRIIFPKTCSICYVTIFMIMITIFSGCGSNNKLMTLSTNNSIDNTNSSSLSQNIVSASDDYDINKIKADKAEKEFKKNEKEKERSKYRVIKKTCKGNGPNAFINDYTKYYEYYNDGVLKKETVYDYQMNIEDIFEYDFVGNKVLHLVYNSYGELYSNGHTQYEYDEKNNVLREMWVNDWDNSITTNYECEYDNQGNRISKVDFNDDGSIKEQYWWDYDEAGRITKETREYNGKDAIYYNHVYLYYYNNKGDKTRTEQIGYDGKAYPIIMYIYKYGRSGNILKTYHYDYGTDIELTAYTYDDDDNKIREEYYYCEQFGYEGKGDIDDYIYKKVALGSIEYEYDSVGNLITEIHSDGMGDITTVVYEYEKVID